MKVGSLVILNPTLYTDFTNRIGIITRVIANKPSYHILWNDGSEAILEYIDLEVLCA